MVNTPTHIMQELVKFYSDLYRSRQAYSLAELQKFLQGVDLPCLSDSKWRLLDSPITIEELFFAVNSFPNSEALGDDGLPTEVYKQYGKMILPQLLKVFNAARERQSLPVSMTKANIVLLLKPGKDLLDLGFHRPISLLQVDIRILAKVLALRLNQAISSIIHSDQSCFIPGKSTAINIRRMYCTLLTIPDVQCRGQGPVVTRCP